jgi:transposase-like protein
MEILHKKCPGCKSMNVKEYKKYTTKNHGNRQLYQCEECGMVFSETKHTFFEGLKTPLSKIWEVIEARTEGMGLNAAVRVFKNAKNTILKWERKFESLHQVLLVYSLVHTFLQLVIEGDEAYTKVGKNVPPNDSLGWTIALQERASRFLWELDCGKREQSLFQQAIETLCEVIQQTEEVSLVTDGERQYGNLLFNLCFELVRTGKPGRPKTTLKQGVKARVKNKGRQKRKKGRKRPKYQAPWKEHPETSQDLEQTDIHANHLEAFFSSLRRKLSSFRRRTNTYAKSQKGLRRVLRMYWVIHNFVRKHFTTKAVPAVKLGVLECGISVEELCRIQFV